MQTYDWRRFARLLRIDRPECWDQEDAQRLPWERGCPYWLEKDGVYLHDLPLREAPPGLGEAEIEALHPGDGGKVLTLPATLPAIIGFLDSSGEYARLPGRLWPRLQRLAAKAAAFSQAWERLNSRAIPFDPKAARKERFIPLKVLLSWLEPLPAPGNSVPELELFALAKWHIQIGYLKKWPYVPGTFDQARKTIDVRVGGEVIGQVMRSDDLTPLADDPENPLIDVLDFAAWFREVNPEFLRLPAGFPGAEAETDTTAKDEPPLDEPEEWPTIDVLAAAFAGLRGWDWKKWKENLGGGNRAPWIRKWLDRPGKGGRGSCIRGHPVGLARGIVEKAKVEELAAVLSRLDDEFSKGELAAWRAHWQAARRGLCQV